MINYSWKQANENGFYFKTNGKRCIITKYNGNDTNVTIPHFIDDKPVRAIGKGAFKNSFIKSVTIPNSVTSIGNQAFFNCSRLISVTCEKQDLSEVKFGEDIFMDTPYIKNNEFVILNNILFKYNPKFNGRIKMLTPSKVFIPNDVSIIEKYAFKDSITLKKLVLNDGLKFIRNGAFYKCKYLDEVSIYGIDETSRYHFLTLEDKVFYKTNFLKQLIDSYTIKTISNLIGLHKYTDWSILSDFNVRARVFNMGNIVTLNSLIDKYNHYYYDKIFNIYVPYNTDMTDFFNVMYDKYTLTFKPIFNLKQYDDYFKNDCNNISIFDRVLYSYYRIGFCNSIQDIKPYTKYLLNNVKVAIRIFVYLDAINVVKQLVEWNILKGNYIRYAKNKAEYYHSKKCLKYLKSLDI